MEIFKIKNFKIFFWNFQNKIFKCWRSARSAKFVSTISQHFAWELLGALEILCRENRTEILSQWYLLSFTTCNVSISREVALRRLQEQVEVSSQNNNRADAGSSLFSLCYCFRTRSLEDFLNSEIDRVLQCFKQFAIICIFKVNRKSRNIHDQILVLKNK